jgi:ABC-type lipoprotein export system ATPase subunit
LDKKKQAKLQWLPNPSQINGDNINNVRNETRSTFRNRKMEYLKDEINELETRTKNKNIKGPLQKQK